MLVVLANSFPAFYGQMMALHLEGDNKVIIGLAGALNLILGGFGGVVFGWLLDRLKKYKAISIGLILSLALVFILFTVLITQGNVALDVVLVSLVGFLLMSLWSTGQNFGGELIYPEKESIYVLILTRGSQFEKISVTVNYTYFSTEIEVLTALKSIFKSENDPN